MNTPTSQNDSPRREERSLRITPAPTPPDQGARDRFNKRRAAGRIAESMAHALGRSNAEAGTVRLATLLAADAGALKLATSREPAAAAAAAVKAALPVVTTRSAAGQALLSSC